MSLPRRPRPAVPALALFALALALAGCAGRAGSEAGAGVGARAGTQQPAVDRAASGLPVTVTDATGKRVTVESAARIASLNGSVTEIIYALGLGANVVGVDTSSTYPAQTEKLATFGYQRSLSAEGILSLSPTVIIGTTDAGPPPVITQLRGTGTPVVIVEDRPTLQTPMRKINAIGKALGVPGRASELAQRTRREIEQARTLAARASTQPRVMFLYLRGQGTQMIAGSDTDAHAMIRAAGAINVGAEIGITGYRPLTPEALVEARPEVLVVLSGGLASVGGRQGLLKIPGVGQTPAAEQGRILAYDGLYLLGMGPRTGQALTELTLALHPGLRR